MNICSVIGPELILVLIGMMLNGRLHSEALESSVNNSVENLFKINNAPLMRSASCITADDLLMMQAKRHYEQMIPEHPLAFEPLSDAIVMQQIDFCNQLEHRTSNAFKDNRTRELMLVAFADAYGAYIYGYLVPVIKYSYYGGLVSHFATNEALRLLTKYQKMLGINDSRGIASSHWQLYDLEPSHFFKQVKPINEEHLERSEEHNCNHLLHVPLRSLVPKVDIDEDTQEILLLSIPYYGNGTVHNPKSKQAGRLLLHYYITVVGCFASKKQSLVAFQQEFTTWIANLTRYILTNDTVLYPAFEGVLQIKESVENDRNLSKKAISAINQHWPDDFETEDSDELSDYRTSQGSQPSMSTVQKMSIWIGCSLAVLLVVYIAFKMQRNRQIITNNRYTHRRRKSSERRRSSRPRKLSKDIDEEDELTVFDRLEMDSKNDGSDRKTTKPQHKFSIAQFMQRIQPRKWKSTVKDYRSIPAESRDVEANHQRLAYQQRNLNDDEPQPGPSGINRKQRSRSCSCISCIERESCQGLDESSRPLRSV